MVFDVSPVVISPNFPGKEVFFIGEMLREDERGYVATKIEFPEEHDEIRFCAEFDSNTAYWRTYAPRGEPENLEKIFDFKHKYPLVKTILVDRVSQGVDVDVLHVIGGPLYYVEEEFKGGEKRTSLLVEAIDVYSSLRKKTKKAMERPDNRVAREFLCELSRVYRKQMNALDMGYEETERKMYESFYLLMRAIIDEDSFSPANDNL